MDPKPVIERLMEQDRSSAYRVFEQTIPDLFEKEGILSLMEVSSYEIEHKKSMLDHSLDDKEPDTVFFIAKIGNEVIGTISYGPCGNDIIECAGSSLPISGEMGSLYVLPKYQNNGIGSRLINAMADHLAGAGIERFCLDSGYKSAQTRWLKKFGEPWIISKDYWGEGLDHMIWLCDLRDLGHLVSKGEKNGP